MTRTRLPALAASTLLLLGAGLTGCSSDDDPGPSTAGGTTAPSSFASSIDDALDLVGEDRVLEITAEQLDGTFGFKGYEINDGRLTMASDGGSDQAGLQCLQAQLVLDGVGSTAQLSIEYADATVDCEEVE